ncbi:TrkH family potassium uptake protein [Mesobacillus foraminis]|uniref:TrkH family potassium uptake protein n=1 Tax=Mesobacillus foraminis TaxID=279826 RepID=UPI0039A16A8E
MLKEKINFRKLPPTLIIVCFYIIAAAISVVLLGLPIALQPGVEWTFIDVLFTAVSAISVTGLSVVSTPDTFSTTGIFILMFILQFGGIGVMTLGTFFWLLFGKKIGLKERQLIQTDQNQSTLSGLVRLMRNILVIITFIELIGGILLGTYFLTYFPTWQEAYLQGFFASVSATTNAGFDITGESLIPFAHDYFVQTVNIILLTLGAIGFPVLIELKDYFNSRNLRKTGHFSLYTKLTTIVFFSLMIIGTAAILLLEANHFLKNKTWHESFFYALFQSSTTRNGGLATMDVSQFSEPTLLVICVLMFIGASPSSVGGGVRTTTFAINILFLFSFLRGQKVVKVFRRELHNDDVLKSLAIMITAVTLCSISVILLLISEPFSLMEIIFEVCSAFGTTGLSMGITADLSTTGKIIITLLMFIGRIGILSLIFLLSKRGNPTLYHFPKERVIIG